jgi:prepilin-type N-terminal cleavage/methylation domain-containing protein
MNARERCGGFTLLEMMVALAILLLGFTSLLAAMSAGAGLRRGADARIEAGLLAEEVFHRLRSESFAVSPGGSVLETDPKAMQGTAEHFGGMRWMAAFTKADERPDLVLATVTVRWMEEGDFVQQEFRTMLPRQEPLGARVERFREQGR